MTPSLRLLLAVEEVLLASQDTLGWDAYVIGSRVRVYAPHPLHGDIGLRCEFIVGADESEQVRLVVREAIAKWRVVRIGAAVRRFLDRMDTARVSA